MLYPVLIGTPEDKTKIYIDFKDCPMAKKLTKKFTKQGKEIYKDIKNKIPKYWFEFVSKYDYYTYNYSKLEKLRNKKFITLKELEKCIMR